MKKLLTRLSVKLIQRFFLKVNSNIEAGDLICHVNNENAHFEAIGIFYTYDLKPFLCFKDLTRQVMYSAPVHEYKRSPPQVYGMETTFL